MRPQVRWPVFTLRLIVSPLILTVLAVSQQAAIDKPVWAPELPDDSALGLRAAGQECVLQNADGCVRMLFAAEKNDKWGFIDNTGKAVVPLAFDQVFAFSEGLAPVKLGKKFGFVDATGNLVIPASWEFVQPFHEGLAAVTDGKKYGFIDKAGKVLIPLQFIRVGNFHAGLAAVGVTTHPPPKGTANTAHFTDSIEYIDTTGRIVIPPADRGLGYPPVTEGRVPFKVDHKWGAMDTSGKIVIEAQYPSELKFSQGLAEVYVDQKAGYIDTDGKMAIPAIYERVGKFSEGLAAVRTDTKWGFVNTSGQLAVPVQFDSAEGFHGEFAAVDIGGKWGIIDKGGKMIIPPQFEKSMTCPTAKDPSAVFRPSAPTFSEGLAAVSIQCKWGFIDTAGHMLIPTAFEEVHQFSEGLAAAKSGGKWGFINKSGKFVIPAQYDRAFDFSDGLAMVSVEIKNGSLSSLIDQTGKTVWGPTKFKWPSPWLIVPMITFGVLCGYRCIA